MYQMRFGGGWGRGVGVPLRGGSTNEPSAKGEFASRPKVTRLVRYGPVRQKTNFSRAAARRRWRTAKERLSGLGGGGGGGAWRALRAA